MEVRTTRKYAEVAISEKVEMVLLALPFPVIMLWALLLSPFSEHTKSKTWRRLVTHNQVKYFLNNLKVNQLQLAFGDSVSNCIYWSKKTGVPLEFEEFEEGGRLVWMGRKAEVDQVIVHCPCGGYVLPVTGGSLSYLQFLQQELKRKGKQVTIAIVIYSLIPTSSFPVPLRQLVFGIRRVLESGFLPNNISITGESAGGNLILQLFSHLLHPHPRVPHLDLTTPLRSAYMMSPWVKLVDATNAMAVHDNTDIVTCKTLNQWGGLVLEDIPITEQAYADPNNAPDYWWNNVNGVIDRTLLTIGDSECLKEECISFSNRFKPHHDDFTLLVQPNAMHADPLLDFTAGEQKTEDIMGIIVDWFAAGM